MHEAFGARAAESITPQDSNDGSAQGVPNKDKTQEAVETSDLQPIQGTDLDGVSAGHQRTEVSVNPAREIERRKENNAA